ncbi:hypothetical protein EDB19DRAFT_1836109 [Suillus lakei]|nr:hypothetical protein EDB19DRAFT_1836109 [Suillus lakei]
MAPFSISSPNVLRDAFRTTHLRLGSHSNATRSDSQTFKSTHSLVSPRQLSAPDSDDTTVSAATSPQVPYTSSYQEPLSDDSDEAKTKKQEERFDSVIDDKLGTIPVRLIDTTSGKLCSAGELCAHFKESRGYKDVEMKILRGEPVPMGLERYVLYDKTNNVELQESIISMFSWYELSSVTIVYLSDVTDEKSFKNSQAEPQKDPQVVKIISEATNIDQTVILNQFVPGLRDVGSDEVKKMSWLALRKTAKIEDMAYCMMGIFGVHMPVMYGERKNAFVRLQKEIMNLTDDLSLFDWVGEPSELHSYFASHPSCFVKPPAGRGRDSSKNSRVRLFQASKAFASAIGSTVVINVKKLLLDPPHGHFIANGKMNMPMFVHEVTKLIPADTTGPPILDADGFVDYFVKAEGLAEVMITTHKLLPITINEEDSPCYRLVRMWDFNLIPPEDAVKKADEETGAGDGDGERHEGSIHTPHWLDRSDILSPMATAVTAAVSHNAVVMFMSRLREPFVAQLLIQRKRGGPYERVGTRERLIAAPSSGSITFRGIKILSVR